MPTATADRRWRSALALAFALALAGCDSRPPEPRLRDEGKSPQHLVMARLEIEHLIPKGRGGLTEEANLWLSCPLCNRAKAGRTTAIDPETGAEEPLFNPRTQRWSDHFAWSWDGLRIMGRTAIGRATVALLRLDSDPDALLVRSYWVRAGWHPPVDDERG